MDDYDELVLAHERYMAHEDLYTKWSNSAMVSQSILLAALSQLLIYRDNISRVIGDRNTLIILIVLPLAGLMLSLIWLLTDWRNFYYTFVRMEVIRDLEASLMKAHEKSKVHIYGFLGREFVEFRALTSGSLSSSYRQHRIRWGRVFSLAGGTISSVLLSRFSTRFRLFLIPAIFALVWLGGLLLGVRLAVS